MDQCYWMNLFYLGLYSDHSFKEKHDSIVSEEKPDIMNRKSYVLWKVYFQIQDCNDKIIRAQSNCPLKRRTDVDLALYAYEKYARDVWAHRLLLLQWIKSTETSRSKWKSEFEPNSTLLHPILMMSFKIIIGFRIFSWI